jgi:DNA-nicking Smr family endonuclease
MGRPSADETGLWRWATRDVVPLRGRVPGHPDVDRKRLVCDMPRTEAVERVRPGQAPRRAVVPHQPAQPLPPLDRFAGIDRSTAERLKRGRYPVEARLDLHGMTQAEAHRALAGIVTRSRMAGRRCLLVITGHGKFGGGVLKTAVPRWLGEPELRRHVLAITPAQPRDGGAGAIYLLLRRLS